DTRKLHGSFMVSSQGRAGADATRHAALCAHRPTLVLVIVAAHPPRSRRKGILVDLALGKLGELGVGPLFLFEALMQKLLVITQFKLTSQSGSGAVSGDLVMFNLLRRRDQSRVTKI